VWDCIFTGQNLKSESYENYCGIHCYNLTIDGTTNVSITNCSFYQTPSSGNSYPIYAEAATAPQNLSVRITYNDFYTCPNQLAWYRAGPPERIATITAYGNNYHNNGCVPGN
jgi:hypothetical protein